MANVPVALIPRPDLLHCQKCRPCGQLENYRQLWKDCSSGRDAQNTAFGLKTIIVKGNKENDEPEISLSTLTRTDCFELDCVGCCWKYLVDTRNYVPRIVNEFEQIDGNKAWIEFNQMQAPQVQIKPLVLMYLDFPHQAAKGQLKVSSLDHANATNIKPFEDSHTYQLYKNNMEDDVPTVLSMLTEMSIRLQSIRATDRDLTANQLELCYFRYYDAALLELWRESQQQHSLRGKIFYSTTGLSNGRNNDGNTAIDNGMASLHVTPVSSSH